MAFVADEGRQYVVAGPWRRRSDVAELIEVSRGGLRASLLATVDTALAAQGVRLLVLDQGAHPVDRELCREAGFGAIERIVEYERSGCTVPPCRSSLDLRPYRPADREAVLELERQSFPWLWWNSREEWDAYVSLPGVDVIVGVDQERLVGYASTTVYYRDGHLDRLAVRGADQGRGFGAALLVAALTHLDRSGAKQVRLTTQADNHRAQALYEKFGFRRGRLDYEIYGTWLAQSGDA